MATFTGTGSSEHIGTDYVDSRVERDPPGSLTSSASDTIYGNGGSDYIDAGGGNDFIYSGAGGDTAYGGAGNDTFDDFTNGSFGGSDTFYGGAGDDIMSGYDGSDQLYGDGGADTLFGEDDSDTLDGGSGADFMSGGSGSDTYFIDDSGDTVEDVAGDEGYDVVHASISFVLGVGLEALMLAGRTAIDGTGNSLANSIYGNGAANTLIGLGGDDYLEGRGGDDRIEGGDGNDYLDGGSGDDQLYGGSGDDRYYITAGDQAFEDAGGGTDSISVDVSWILGEHFENLDLSYSSDPIDGTGNASANTISGTWGNNTLRGLAGDDVLQGNGGNDRLYGDAGVDTMYGADGNDTYFVDDSRDQAIEWDYDWDYDGGFDTVYSTVSFALGEGIETLRMIPGSGVADLKGNALDNELWGTSDSNTIRGLGGDDTIDSGNGIDLVIGGRGGDTYLFLGAIVSNPLSRDTLRRGNGAAAFENAGAEKGDLIDLSRFDADLTTSGEQDFIFGAVGATSGLWAENAGRKTLICGNIDGDAEAEFELLIADGAVLATDYSGKDFIL